MAAEDLTRTGSNHMKRNVSVAVSDELTGTQIATDGCTVFTLPPKSAVVRLYLYISVASGGGTDTVDVDYAGSEIGSEISAENTGITEDAVTVANAYSATGGAITITDGADGVAAALRCRLIVEYIELDKVSGELTNVTMS